MVPKTLADVIQILEKQQKEIQRLKDVNEIQNLMGTYEFWHTAGLNEETIEQLWAKKTLGVRTEIANFGVYDDPEGTRKFWYENARSYPRGPQRPYASAYPDYSYHTGCRRRKYSQGGMDFPWGGNSTLVRTNHCGLG